MPVTVDLPLVPPTAMPSRGGVEQRGEQLRPGDPRRADRLGLDHIGHRLLDRRGGDDDLIGADDAAAVLREQGDAACAQEFELGGEPALVERPVRAGDLVPAALDDQRQRQHAAAADAAEEIGFGLAHRLALLGSAGSFKRVEGRGAGKCGSRWWRRAPGSRTGKA